MFTETLSNYLEFARQHLHLPAPLQLEAGLTGIKGYPIAVEQRHAGTCVNQSRRVDWYCPVIRYRSSRNPEAVFRLHVG